MKATGAEMFERGHMVPPFVIVLKNIGAAH
jgi:hypothetical protein